MFLLALKFFLGIGILLFSTEKFVQLAKRIAISLAVSPLVIGVTIVAIGTSVPELVVSAVSMSKGDAGLALGNIIGSNIINILLVFSVGLLIGGIQIGRYKTQSTSLFLLVSTLIFFIMQAVDIYHIYKGFILITVAGLFTIMEYRMAVVGREQEDMIAGKKQSGKSISLAQILIGGFLLLLIIIGGIFVVDAAENISRISGISTSILGLTLTAIATSLPELLTTVYSQKNSLEKITVGNVLGSNVYNLMLIGGVIYLFPVSTFITRKESLWLGLTTVCFAFFLNIFGGRRPSRWYAILTLSIFLIYTITQ